jgi:hypothetical protein
LETFETFLLKLALLFNFELGAMQSAYSEQLLFLFPVLTSGKMDICFNPVFSFSLQIALGVQVFLLQNPQTQDLMILFYGH